MRILLLFLCFVCSSQFVFSQEVEKKKEVVVIKKQKGTKEISDIEIEEISSLDDVEDIKTLLKKLNIDMVDSVDVEVDVEIKDGKEVRTYIVTSTKDGKEEVSKVVKEVMKEPIKLCELPPVRLGVLIAESTIIKEVVEGSPAEESGLKKGDVIKKIDNQIIYSVTGLLEHLSSYKLGDKVLMTIERDGKLMTSDLIFKAYE